MSDPAIHACDEFITKSSIDKTVQDWRTKLPKPPSLPFEGSKTYYWDLDTSHGPIRVKLNPGVAPQHVSSTMFLSRLGFYDDLTFHRVIPGFMAQGGCPIGTGTGGPGYQYDGEFDNSVRHTKGGLLSMANAGPGTDGSQFFLTFTQTPWLDGKHTIFGEAVDGLDTLKSLEALGSDSGSTSEPLIIKKTSLAVE
ncbi:MAG: peptidylprolyl isomerase [Planctomycetota bacterium]|jgi:cyclophilin family peptidyl-prolyl cis-trans isomerase